MRSITIILAIIFVVSNLSSQQLTHRLGEIIVEVADDRNLAALVQELGREDRFNQVKKRQVSESPMNLWVLSIDFAEINEEEFLAKVIMSSHTLMAQKNHLVTYRAHPNDPYYTDQWQYFNVENENHDLDIEQAWDIATGGVTSNGDTIVVAVIDSGVDYHHEDLQDNMWKNYAEVPDNDIDDDGNGYVDDYHGWSITSNSDEINSVTHHGTEVTGIIGAKGNNGIGVAGVSWDVKVMFIQGGGDEASVLESYAYPYAMRKKYNETDGEEGAFIVATNSSWGTDYAKAEDAPLWCDFYNIMGEEGILSCGATSNTQVDVDIDGDLPTSCSSNYLISVTNLNKNDQKVNAGYGKKTIDLGAYGEGTFTTSSSDNYRGFGGTSGATPHVCGTIGLLYSTSCSYLADLSRTDPAKAALSVRDFILNGVIPNDDLTDITTTEGKLNVYRAMQAAIAPCASDCSPAYAVENRSTGIFSEEIEFNSVSGSLISLRFREEGRSDWNYREDITSPYELDNLDNCTTYEVQLGSSCDATTFDYSRYITTEGCCAVPSIADHIIENGTVRILWDASQIADRLDVLYRVEDGNWKSITITDADSYTFPIDLQDCSRLDVRIKASCSLTDEDTEYSNIYKIYSDCGSCLKDYCDFSGLDNEGEYISKFGIKHIFERISDRSEDGYEFIADENIILNDNYEYQANLEVTYKPGSEYAENLAVFIDLNFDGIYQENERLLYESDIQGEAEVLFTIPTLANYGTTRMRVAMLYDPIAGGCKSGDQKFGEVEDYCIELQSQDACPSYTDLIITEGLYSEDAQIIIINPEDNFKTFFEVENNGSSALYGIEIKEEGSTDFLTYTSGQPMVEVPIERCKIFEIRAFAECDGQRIRSESYVAKVECKSNTVDRKNSTVSLYPNPGSIFHLKADITIDEVFIYDTKGQLVISENNILDTKSYGRDLTSGVYLIVVKSDQNTHILKWVKNIY